MRRNPLSCRSVLLAWPQLLLGPLGPGNGRPMEPWGRPAQDASESGDGTGLDPAIQQQFGPSRSRAMSMTWLEFTPMAIRMPLSLRRRSISQDKMPSGRPGRSLSRACSRQRTTEDGVEGRESQPCIPAHAFRSGIALLARTGDLSSKATPQVLRRVPVRVSGSPSLVNRKKRERRMDKGEAAGESVVL